ncbi:hypothetical protein [Streptomyces sp. NPDC058664]|uniref:hypothetical protein n=1 Tax=unclassified Streptomyces TaxID=2593676 RepID=UPI00365BB3E6
MDETKTIEEATYKVVIAGTEYEFAKPDPQLVERMILVRHMNADGFVVLEACTKWLSVAAGKETWAVIMRRFMNGEITAQDLLTSMNDLLTAWTDTEDPTANAA